MADSYGMTTSEPPTKRCTGPCGVTKPLGDFARNRRAKDGRRATCRACDALRDAARYASKKAAGVCVYCPAPALAGRTCCKVHAVAIAARAARKKAVGACRSCPAPAVPGKTLCEAHAAAALARAVATYAADPAKVNAVTSKAKRKAYAAAKAERRCVWDHGRGCDQPADEGLTMCSTHRAEDAERRRIRQLKPVLTESVAGPASWEARDHWRCAYTGEPWDEVEHMIAVNSSDGAKGSNDPGNLVPASRAINSAKTNRPYGEFLRDTYPHLFERGALSAVLNELYPGDLI